VIEQSGQGARVERFAPFLVAALAFAVATWASRPYAVGVFHDDGVYAILAKSLATGQGYRYLHLPGAPVATHYPPGYPLFLAMLWRLAPEFPGNVALFLLANSLLLGVTAWGIHRFATRILGWTPAAAIAVAVVATVAYPLVMLSGLVLSEPLFVALLFPVLIAAEGTARDEEPGVRALVVGVAAGLLALVRTHAVAVALALILVFVLRRRWRAAVLCALGVAAVLAPWQIWSARHAADLAGPLRGSYGSYGSWLAEGLRVGGPSFVWQTMVVNVRETGELLADRFALRDSSGVRLTTAWFLCGLIALGGWRMARRAPVSVAFAVVYFAIVLVWPYTPWRFFFAAWPLVVLLVGEALHAVTDRRLISAARWVGVAAAVAVVAGAAREESRAYLRRAWARPANAATAQIAPLVSWVARTTSKDDVVAAEGEQLVYLFTGRQALPLVQFTAAEYLRPVTVAEGAAGLAQILKLFPVSYVLTISPPVLASADKLVGREADDASMDAGGPARLVRIGTLPGGGIFRVERQ
jgi:hypothetical protein